MKVFKLKFVRTLIVLCVLPGAGAVHAQFLKRIVNDVKQTAQNRADNKANRATDKALDKVDSPSGSKSTGNSSQTDTAAIGGVLGAFAKAAQDNPNDTSMSDVISKGLGNLVGGGGVSAADSASAINVFKHARGGSGTYYEYTVQTNTKEKGAARNTTKMYLTSTGEGRSEMDLAAMMGAKSSAPMIVIGRANQPRYSVMLDNESKLYSLNVIDTALIGTGMEKNKVTKLGNENVQGYNCVHAKVVSKTGSGLFSSTTTMDVWTSTEVPGYADFKKGMLQNVTPSMVRALNDAGCAGFFVKMVSGDKHYSMTMELTKAEKNSFSASMFEIPGNYNKSDGNLMFGNLMKASKPK